MLFVAAELVQKRPMVDFALFRKRTFLGDAFAMLGYAAAAQVMMTYLPLYLQNVFGLSPAAAGLGMLPFALPLFFCPRIAVVSFEPAYRAAICWPSALRLWPPAIWRRPLIVGRSSWLMASSRWAC